MGLKQDLLRQSEQLLSDMHDMSARARREQYECVAQSRRHIDESRRLLKNVGYAPEWVRAE